MNIDTVWEGIIIGGAGGFIAGISVWIISILREKISEWNHKKRIYNWLYHETEQLGHAFKAGKLTFGPPNDPRWRSTREIATFNNLTIDRVNYICSIHEKIRLIRKEELRPNAELWPNEPMEEKWAIKEFVTK